MLFWFYDRANALKNKVRRFFGLPCHYRVKAKTGKFFSDK